MSDICVRNEHDKVWYDVPGYEDLYQVTRTGLLRSKGRYVNSPVAGGRRFIPERLLKILFVKGYPAWSVKVDNTKRTVYLHRVLAELFIPNPERKPHINHKDGDKKNFYLANLEWCTHQENMRHAFKTGLAPYPATGPGERSPSAKLDNEKIRDIKRRLKAGEPQRSIARRYGVSQGTIGFIARGETWAHVGLDSAP